MITLLMAFFIMLYSMSILNTGKFNQVAVSIKSGFGGIVPGQGRSILNMDFRQPRQTLDANEERDYRQMVKDLQSIVQDRKLGRVMRLREDERGIVISLSTDRIIFNRGKVALSPTATRILSPIADVLKKMPNQLRVEGHTCDLRIISDNYPSNWELSSARACSVVRYLVDKKSIPAARMSVSGYASYRPIVPNTNEENRAQNRRVDIVVLRTGIR
jgi:chemotaxis protein MotB